MQKDNKRNNIGYCINCDDDVPYYIKYSNVGLMINGVQFQYNEAKAICKRCGEEIYVNWVNDWNVAERNIAYHRARADHNHK